MSMHMKKSILVLVLFLSIVSGAIAQNRQVLDGAYIKRNNRERAWKIPRYASLRESDVLWQKRVWQDIYASEKMNFPLFFTGSS